ncbi:MAG: neutral/alkaline non-lysosomal ceramidase N-terminal domain-containing protein [Caldilineaceae bacterium]|nr:neutral/alkaline non-lysosomal ceramidase N-terminal domain-containing protein [Caldilineaceae bacterium]
MSAASLQVGFSLIDITPPTGLYMCGSLDPRTNEGTLDPLQVRTMVVASQGRKIAIVGVDLISLPRSFVDPVIAAIASQTGISADAILISCSHTHNGPYTQERHYSHSVIDAEYLESVAARLIDGVVKADAALQHATAHIGRALVHHGQHQRRVLSKKDGKALNTWMPAALNDLDVTPQILGSVGPIDPELWVLRFDDLAGSPLGIFFNYSVHANARGTLLWSADYPGVVASRVRATLGDNVITVYAPGACADVNPVRGSGDNAWQEVADNIAEQTLDAAHRAQPLPTPVVVNGIRRDISVPRRDPATQPPEAIERLNWGGKGGRSDHFGPHLQHILTLPEMINVPVSALHIGPFAIASNPGELFVEYGLQIKTESPFPHTVVAELTNDSIAYQPTRRAFELQGYETLVGANVISVEGIETIVDTASALLSELWQAAQE